MGGGWFNFIMRLKLSTPSLAGVGSWAEFDRILAKDKFYELRFVRAEIV